jgi:DNA repair exonuclease SbcCD ATPase subunit
LRELGIMLRKSGITASQCAVGFRLASIMKELGVNQDNFGHFISETYNQCGEIGLQPKHIAYNTKQILDLAGSMPLSQIHDYIQEKTTEKRKLEEDISKIAQEQLQAKATLEEALHKKKSTLVQLEQFSDLKVELDKLHISVQDIPRTVALFQGLRRNGYNVDTLALLVSNWEASGAMQAELEKRIADLTAAERDLRDRWERLTFLNQQKESLFKELQDMGCGLKELKVLSGIIHEVAAERGIPENMAVQMFLQDIEKNYDNKLGYESMLGRLRSEIANMNKELNTTRSALALNKGVAIAATGLLSTGFSDQQILNLAWALQSDINNKECLEADLNKYRSLKKAIEGLNQELRNLEGQIKPSEVIRMPKEELHDVKIMQESATLAPLIKATRGEKVEVGRLKHAFIGAMDIAISRIGPDNEASDAFKRAKDMVNNLLLDPLE